MAMAKPSSNGPSTKQNDQLITPRLTPVSEDWPSEGLALSPSNDLSHEDGATTPQGVSSSPASDVRNRSTSLPSKQPAEALQAIGGAIGSRRSTTASLSIARQDAPREVLKLSSAQLQELTSAPDSLPVRSASVSDHGRPAPRSRSISVSEHRETESPAARHSQTNGVTEHQELLHDGVGADWSNRDDIPSLSKSSLASPSPLTGRDLNENRLATGRSAINPKRPAVLDIPPRRTSASENRTSSSASQLTDESNGSVAHTAPNSKAPALLDPLPSPMPDSLPIPPYSMPTHLHLELASERPSPLYIHRSASSDIQFEPTSVKFERLLNFLLLPPQLERVLLFGALTCLDAWLYTFTILPLRFLKALWILIEWIVVSIFSEVCYLANFVYGGLGRLWRRRGETQGRGLETTTATSRIKRRVTSNTGANTPEAKDATDRPNRKMFASQGHLNDSAKRHRRSRSVPSLLQPNHKADLLQGALITISCMILLKFDASRMYHGIRGQSAIKLYVIYNVLEVCDRLFSALGQDINECLFSPETLERKPNGRSKLTRPFWMFILALVYTVIHATTIFYQVITLNVAVNSFSNALLTLLMSNQFVEIKGTVFKKFEKENLFQLTCADIVERFQLWLMLVIIALRNIVELGGISVGSGEFEGPSSSGSSSTNVKPDMPLPPFGILPNSFNILPSLFPAQVLGPFLLVLGSEMLVDSLKHAYITKFNATSPALYGRFFDVLAKDYYSNAFTTQNLVRRLGLPTIPLACLFIRAILQTYHMFLATTISIPSINITSAATSLSIENETATSFSPALVQIDHIFRNALGRSSFGGGVGADPSPGSWWHWHWSLDDAIALTTMLVFFLALYLLMLAFKLVLGMLLLGVARKRYRGMKKREQERIVKTQGKRTGAWGTIEVGEDRRRWIYDGDPEALKTLREKEAKSRDKEREARESGIGDKLESVDRYRMVAKRIW